jgi:hypothetical protein
MLAPPAVEDSVFTTVVIVSEVIAFLLAGLVLGAFAVFTHSAKLSQVVIYVTSVTLNGLLSVWSILLASLLGGCLASGISGTGSSSDLVFAVLAIVILAPTPHFLRFFVSSMLVLRPQSIHFSIGVALERHLVLDYFGVCLNTFGSSLGGTVGDICVYLSSLGWIGLVVIYHWHPYDLITLEELRRTAPFYINAFLLTIINQSLALAGASGDEIIFVITAGVLLVTNFVYHHYFNRMQRRMYRQCEIAGNDLEVFETLPYRQAITVAKLAFEVGYPLAHQWILFQSLLARRPSDLSVLCLFARYAAVYPSEDAILRLAAMRLAAAKHGRLGIKHLLFDVLSLLQQRESELSDTIGKSLNRMRRQAEKVCGEIRYLWDGVIRGSLDELEGLAVYLKSAQTDIIYDFNQLCLMYPNNPFVAQAYAHFLGETMNNVTAAGQMSLTAQLLRMGHRVRIERFSYCASNFFPTLPDDAAHAAILGLSGGAHAGVGDEAGGDALLHGSLSLSPSVGLNGGRSGTDFATEEAGETRSRVEAMISAVRLPTLRIGPVFIVLLVVVFTPDCTIPIAVMAANALKMNRNDIEVLPRVAECEVSVLRLSVVYLHASLSGYFCETIGPLVNLQGRTATLTDRWRTVKRDEPVPKSWETDTKALRAAMLETRRVSDGLGRQMLAMSAVDYAVSLGPFFKPLIEIQMPIWRPTGLTWGPWFLSLEEINGLLMKAVYEILPMSALERAVNPVMWTVMRASRPVVQGMIDFARGFVDEMRDVTVARVTTIRTIAIGAVMIPLLLSLVAATVILIGLSRENACVFGIFRALPKAVLSGIVQNLSTRADAKTDDPTELVDRKSTRLNSSHVLRSRMPSSA